MISIGNQIPRFRCNGSRRGHFYASDQSVYDTPSISILANRLRTYHRGEGDETPRHYLRRTSNSMKVSTTNGNLVRHHGKRQSSVIIGRDKDLHGEAHGQPLQQVRLSFNMSNNTEPGCSPSLLRLPAELRIQIFACVFTSPTPLSIHCWRRYTPFCLSTRVLQYPPRFLALLLTCRQIYSEARLLPFKCNAFRFKSQDAFEPWLAQFCPEQTYAFRTIEIVTWMARHMVEGESWVAKRVEDCLPIHRLRGLRTVLIEVRMNGRNRDCIREECWNCEGSDCDVMKEMQKLMAWFHDRSPGLQIEFERVAA